VSWEYRVIRSYNEEEAWYEIHEVYYNDRTGKVKSMSVNAMDPCGENLGELVECIKDMLKATEKPILEETFDKGGDWTLREVKE